MVEHRTCHSEVVSNPASANFSLLLILKIFLYRFEIHVYNSNKSSQNKDSEQTINALLFAFIFMFNN